MSESPARQGSTGTLRRGSLTNLAGAAAASASTLLLVVLTARILSPADAGRVFGLTSAFLIVAAVLRVGTPTGVVLFISRHDDSDVRPVVRLALRPIFCAAIVVSLALLPFRDPIARALHLGPQGSETLLVLAVCLPTATVLDTMLAVSRGRHQMGPTVLVDRIGRPALQLALTLLAALSPSVFSLAAAWAAPYVVAAIAAWVLTPDLRRQGARPEPEPGMRTQFVRFVLLRGLATIIQVCFARLDIVLVASLAGPAEAAIYTAATRFVSLCQFVQQAVAGATEPALARALGAGRTAEALEIYRTTTVWLVSLLWPVLLLVVVLAPEWLAVFGPSYSASTAVVLILAVAMLVATSVGMVETVLNMDGRPAVLVTNNVVALVVMVGVDLVLIPQIGAVGAALGWGAAIVVKNLAAVRQLAGSVGGSPVSASWQLAVLLNVVALGAVPALAALASDTARIVSAGFATVGLLVAYAVLSHNLRLDQLLGWPRGPVSTERPS